MLLTIEKIIFLKSIDLFSEISQEDLQAVASQLEVLEYQKNDIIIHQGDVGTSMYIVIHGEVDVDVNGKIVATLGEKNVFGELAALDPEPRSATVIATKETLIFKINSTVIYNLISEYSNAARGIIRVLCQRIRESN
jgi:CRP/FNR family transcriptional regulator, cyclic AMP receptor protein